MRDITTREAEAIRAASLAAPKTYAEVSRRILAGKADDDTKAAACILAARLIPQGGADAASEDDVRTYARQALSLARRRMADETREEPTDPFTLGTGGIGVAATRAASPADGIAKVTGADRIRAALSLADDDTRPVLADAIRALAATDSGKRTGRNPSLYGALISAKGLNRNASEARRIRAAVTAWLDDVAALADAMREAPCTGRTAPRYAPPRRMRTVATTPYDGRHSGTAASVAGTAHTGGVYVPGTGMWDSVPVRTAPSHKVDRARAVTARTSSHGASELHTFQWEAEARTPRRPWGAEALALSDAAREEADRQSEAMRAARSATAVTMGAHVLSFYVSRAEDKAEGKPYAEARWALTDAESGRRMTGGIVTDDEQVERLREASRSHALTAWVAVGRHGAPDSPEAKRAEALAAAPRKSPKPVAPSRRSRAAVTGATVTR